ncbi:MAG: hypothetical protein LC099_07635 [Anaerolineales bacterium]|nr:hypothetical protein [Anaerolineales bacterium]
MSPKIFQRAAAVCLIILAALLLAQAAFSLRWPLAHDEAPLFYEAFLMQNGRVPYRDFFDFQMPGAYLAYYFFAALTNFGATRVRLLDLAILSVLSAVTFYALRRDGKLSACAAPVLFGLAYLQGGPSLSLQREYLILIFIALSIWIGARDSLTFRKRLILGFLYGLAATLKPHAALGLLPFIFFDTTDFFRRSKFSLPSLVREIFFPFVLGFSIPVLGIILWLISVNALNPFLDIVRNYVPLYAQINGAMEIVPANERAAYLFSQLWRFGGHGLWLIPAALGVLLNRKRQTYLLAGLALVYALYPALSGQFFPYHYLPFLYCLILLSSSILSNRSQILIPNYQLSITYAIFLFVIFFSVRPSQTFLRQLRGEAIVTSTDRAAQIADFLQSELQPGDAVQDLDWTGGALLAMLRVRAPLATHYVFDFYFYHHVSTPYVQSLRADFLTQLQTSPPRFIVEVSAIDKPWVSGADASRDFPELRAFLDERYSVTIAKDDYLIYELKNSE